MLETARTYLDLLTEADLPAMEALAREEDTFRYLKKLRVMCASEYTAFLHLKLEQIRTGMGYHWVVRRKEDGQFIGAVNLNPIRGTSASSQTVQPGSPSRQTGAASTQTDPPSPNTDSPSTQTGTPTQTSTPSPQTGTPMQTSTPSLQAGTPMQTSTPSLQTSTLVQTTSPSLQTSTPMMQVGAQLSRAVWEQGYASELMACLVRYALDELKLPVVYGVFEADNRASRRLLEKLGFAFEERVEDNGLVVERWRLPAQGQA